MILSVTKIEMASGQWTEWYYNIDILSYLLRWYDISWEDLDRSWLPQIIVTQQSRRRCLVELGFAVQMIISSDGIFLQYCWEFREPIVFLWASLPKEIRIDGVYLIELNGTTIPAKSSFGITLTLKTLRAWRIFIAASEKNHWMTVEICHQTLCSGKPALKLYTKSLSRKCQVWYKGEGWTPNFFSEGTPYCGGFTLL